MRRAKIACRYPCRCLCFGVREQITRITPLRLITLQYSQRGFTDARTFILASLRRRTPPCCVAPPTYSDT